MDKNGSSSKFAVPAPQYPDVATANRWHVGSTPIRVGDAILCFGTTVPTEDLNGRAQGWVPSRPLNCG